MRTLPAVLMCAVLLPAAALAQPAAEIVSLQGKGDHRATAVADWRPARVKLPLEAGSFVRTTEAASKMSLLLVDQTQLTLQGVSVAQVKSPETAGPRKSIIEFGKGRGRFQTKTPTKSFAVGTPTGLAAIRGTEWLVEVDDDGRSSFIVVEGELEISNDLGTLSVGADEQGILERGKPPSKVRLQNARERVQWVGSLTLDSARYPQAGVAGSADALLLAAETDLYFGRTAQAQQRIDEAAGRHPSDARLAALAIRAALLADDFARARASAAAAIAKFPDSLEVQLAAGEAARLDGDARAARRAFRRATQLAPGDWRGWHGLGQVHAERSDPRRARRALAAADRLSPGNARVLGELGSVEANAWEVERGREILERALAAQPDDFATWTGLGIARLKSGDVDGALEALLKATLIEPRYARAHIHLAVAYWQQGRADDAFKQLATASRHDPRDPVPYQLAAMMHADLLRPGDALASARSAVERLPYVKSLDAIANNLRGSANLGAPLAQLGLEAWALKNAQDSFDPLWAGSHLFLADRLDGKFVANSELVQGFLTDPLAFGASNRFQTLVSRPGHYGTVALRGARSSEATIVEPLASVNGLVDAGRIAYFLEGARTRAWSDDKASADRAASITLGVGIKPRDDVGFFLYASRLLPESRTGFERIFDPWQLIDGVASRIDAGVHYRPGPDWQVWVKGGHGYEDSRLQERIVGQVGTAQLLRDSFFTTQPRRGDIGARALCRFAGGLEASVVVEGALWKSVDFLERDAFGRQGPSSPRFLESVLQEIRDESRSAALGARWPIHARLLVEAEADRTTYEKTNAILVRRDFANQLVPLADDHERREWSARAGVVARPGGGLTLRAAYQEWLRPAAPSSLKPASTAGIVLDDRYVLAGGRFERTRMQAEWEARANLLVTAFADRQEIDNLYSALVGVLNNRPDTSNLQRLRNRTFNALATLDALEGFPEVSKGDLRESGFAVNALATRRLSLFAEGVWATSENTGSQPGKRLAFLPRQRFALGATFFSDARWNAAVKATRRGERFQDEANARRLEPEWSGAVQAYWETRDKRWSVETIVTNIGAKTADESVGIAVNFRY